MNIEIESYIEQDFDLAICGWNEISLHSELFPKIEKIKLDGYRSSLFIKNKDSNGCPLCHNFKAKNKEDIYKEQIRVLSEIVRNCEEKISELTTKIQEKDKDDE